MNLKNRILITIPFFLITVGITILHLYFPLKPGGELNAVLSIGAFIWLLIVLFVIMRDPKGGKNENSSNNGNND